MIPMDKAKRDFRMLQRREKGDTLKKIGRTYGMTGEGIRQVIRNQKGLIEDLQKGGLRGHGLDTHSVNVLRVLMKMKTPYLDDVGAWLQANPDWRWQVRNARNGGVTTIRHIEEFAIQERLLERKPDGIHNTGVVPRLCAALERLTRIDNPTENELKAWFEGNATWEDYCQRPAKRVTSDEADAIRKYARRAGLVENPYGDLSVRAFNCMLVVCPDIRRADFSATKLQAWFAEHPLWFRQITSGAACGVGTENEIKAFVVGKNLADLSKAPSEAVYDLLDSLLHCNMAPCRDLSYAGLRDWFGKNPGWHERLRTGYGFRGDAIIRAVEEYVKSEKLAETA